MRHEIRLSGFGGQGVVLAGYLLGKAFSLYSELEAVMTQSYGPEARGGASSSNIVVADRSIAYPFVQKADIFVALSQEGYARYRPETTPDAKVLIDGGLVMPDEGDEVLSVNATELAESLGRRIVANVVMLGFLCAVTGVVTREALEQAIRTTVKPSIVPLNLEALELGLAQAQREGVS
ncbi:MAG: 2-oxoacid:acceptor oxidoreductase family protein [Anaerolineales bacterium]|jgi:2-oxoglutarate ferredoxin oxidoreductase subunit gamma